MKQNLCDMRVVEVKTPWYLEEYNRQHNKEYAEIQFVREEIFHQDCCGDIDSELFGQLQINQVGSMDRYKLVWDMKKFKYDGYEERIEALSKRLVGKRFYACLFRFSVKELLKKYGLDSDYILIKNSDTLCSHIYKVYVGQNVDEDKAIKDIVFSLTRHFANKDIEVVDRNSYFDLSPRILSEQEFYLIDLDFDEYYRYQEKLKLSNEDSDFWTDEELKWAYAAAFEFDLDNQYGIIE